jgi:hypothetical protein
MLGGGQPRGEVHPSCGGGQELRGAVRSRARVAAGGRRWSGPTTLHQGIHRPLRGERSPPQSQTAPVPHLPECGVASRDATLRKSLPSRTVCRCRRSHVSPLCRYSTASCFKLKKEAF